MTAKPKLKTEGIHKDSAIFDVVNDLRERLDVVTIKTMPEISKRLDVVTIETIPELDARIDNVAEHGAERDVAMQELYSKFELLSLSLAHNVDRIANSLGRSVNEIAKVTADLSSQVDRIGVRRIEREQP